VSDKRKKKRSATLFSGEESWKLGESLSQEEEELLERLAELGFEGRSDELTEPRFRRKHADFHYTLRSRFGSYSNAVGLLAKRELGSPLTAKQLLAQLKEMYGSGQPVTLESLIVEDLHLARAVVGEFGALANAWEEFGIDPATAEEDRRWERDKIFAEMLELVGDSPGDFSEDELLSDDPLLREVIRLAFGSFASFRKEFPLWVEEQPALFVYWGRQLLSRILLRSVSLTSRATKGRNLHEVSRIRNCFAGSSGQRLCFISTEGLLYPLDKAQIPFVSFGVDSGKAGYKLPALSRGEKPVAFLSWEEREGYLAMVTRLGRLKLVDLATFKRVRQQGTTMIRLAAGDQLAAATLIPKDFARVAVVTRNGRAVAFGRESLKLSTRTSMGVIRLRFDTDRNAEPVSILGFSDDEDLVLLGRNGNLLRLRNEEVPTRKGASLGRKLWKTQVVSTAVCPEQAKLLLATKRGRILHFWDAQVPLRHVQRIGVMGIRLETDDAPEVICSI